MTMAVRNACSKAVLTVCAVVLACGVAFPAAAWATVSAVYTATAAPSYSNPITGEFEDSGAASNQALGESMVVSCTYENALVEIDTDGTVYFTIRFNLADQISDMQFQYSSDGSNFTETEATQMQYIEEDDSASADYRFVVSSTSDIVRVNMYVEPMGRYVIYFVSVEDLVEGNTDTFIQTITAGEGTDDDASETDATDEDEESAEDLTDEDENTGVTEYNADGQEVTNGGSSDLLSGKTVGIIVGIIVVIAAAAGVVVYVTYLRPKRAREAAAAAAASMAAAEADDDDEEEEDEEDAEGEAEGDDAEEADAGEADEAVEAEEAVADEAEAAASDSADSADAPKSE